MAIGPTMIGPGSAVDVYKNVLYTSTAVCTLDVTKAKLYFLHTKLSDNLLFIVPMKSEKENTVRIRTEKLLHLLFK